MFIANLFINFFGVLISLFIFWKRMKEDYSSEIIFKSLLYAFLGISLFYLISFNFLKDWFIWFTSLGAVLGLVLAHFSQKVRFFESLESFIISSLPWISLIFLSDSIASQSFISFSGFIYTLTLMFLSYWLESNYKNFFWYKSGKIGLSGLIILAIIFISRLTVAFFQIPMLSFVSNWDLWLSGTFLLITISLIYSLGKTE